MKIQSVSATVLVASIGASYATVSAAQVAYVNQNRTISAGASSSGLIVKSAPDFLPWSDSIEVFGNNFPDPPSRAFVSQTSRLDPIGIFATARCEGEDRGTSGGGGGTIATSIIDVIFRLDAPSEAVLRYLSSGFGGGASSVTSSVLRLTSETATLLDESFGASGFLDLPLTLAAGQYRLYLEDRGGMPGSGVGLSGKVVNLSFIVPAPGSVALLALGAPLAARRRR